MSRARRRPRRTTTRRPPSSRPIKLGLLTCLWQRHALTEIVLGHYAALRDALAPTLQLVPLAVGSEGQTTRSIAERHGFRYLEHANQPLGAKWNAGLRAFRQTEIDALLIVGSDDLLDEPLVARFGALLHKGARFIGLRDMYFFDQPSRRLLHWPGYVGPRAGETTGLGRCIHRRYLEAADWHLWDDALQSGLDRSMMTYLAPHMAGQDTHHHILDARAAGFAPVDVKTAINLWSYDQVAASGQFEHLEADAFLREHFPADLVDALLTLDDSASASRAAPTPNRVGPVTEARIGPSGGRVLWAVPTAPSHHTPDPLEERLTALLERGELAFAAGHVEDAGTAFSAVLEAAPTNPRALNDIAVVHHACGDLENAERALLKAALFDPTSADALVNLASINRTVGRLAEAAAYIERAIDRAGRTPEILDETASLLEANGERDRARALRRDLHTLLDHPPIGYRAAFVELDITPTLDRPTPLQGLWTDRPRLATGIDDPLRAQVLLLEDDYGTRSLIVSADIFAFDPCMVARIEAWAAIWAIEARAILLNASHTHYGPGTFDGAVPGLGPIDSAYAEAVCDAIGHALPVLYRTLAPAAISITRADARIGHNRRLRQGNTVVMAPAPDEHYERETPILIIERADESCILVNHGCHPTGLGAATAISADFVGTFRDTLSEALTRPTTVMFLQGAAGDIKHGPQTPPGWSIDRAATRTAGRALAAAVRAAIDGERAPVTGPIIAARHPFTLPLKPTRPPADVIADPKNAHIAAGLLREWAATRLDLDPPDRLTTRLDVIALGTTAICAFHGEPVAAIAHRLRARVTRHENVFILGYTNGLQAYIPTDDMIRAGGYEAHRSHFVYRLPAGLDVGTDAALLTSTDEALARVSPPIHRPAPAPRPPRRHEAFFVLSTGRSGTQTLAHLLAPAPGARVWHHPEPKLIEETLAAYQGSIDRRGTFWQGRGHHIRAAWDDGLMHGETDHNMTPFCDIIAEDIPAARFLVLVRDPREFIRSGMRRGYYRATGDWERGRLRPAPDDPRHDAWLARDQFDQVAWLWAETYRHIERIRDAIGPDRVRLVRFEDLTRDPDETRAIYDFLGLDGYDEQTTRTILGQRLNAQQLGDFPHPADWSADLHARCWAEVGPLAARYGYPVTYRRPTR